MARPKLTVHIRWMIRRDMEEVLRIECEEFDYPWTTDDFCNCLRRKNCIGMVAEHDGNVAAYMVYELDRCKIVVYNFAVAHEYQRHGVGWEMARKLIGKLSSQRRRKIVLDVVETNLDAMLFWRAMGFRCVEIRKDEYPEDPDLEAYRFEYRYATASKPGKSSRRTDR